jgi:hypothetical protein
MVKSALIKGFMMGLCLSAITAGTAFAQSVEGTTPAYSGTAQSQELKDLYAKQSEIDRYLFVDHAKEIEEKGFMVNYTGVNETAVEIGISPYTEENANYLYDLFGSTDVKVVEFDQSVIYATTAVGEATAPDATATDEVQPEEFSIQIESAGDEVKEDAAVDDSLGIYNAADEDAQENDEVKLVSAAENNVLPTDAAKKAKDDVMSTPLVILAIAGGAALIGGSVIVSNKKKSVK